MNRDILMASSAPAVTTPHPVKRDILKVATKAKFDRTSYQRELMRSRRAAEKAAKAGRL